MAIDKVWVLAEVAEGGGPTPVTLELLTEARAVGSTVEAVAWGSRRRRAGRPARRVRRHDASTTSATSAARCPACPVAAAMAALIEGGNAPDAILLPGHLRGP